MFIKTPFITATTPKCPQMSVSRTVTACNGPNRNERMSHSTANKAVTEKDSHVIFTNTPPKKEKYLVIITCDKTI